MVRVALLGLMGSLAMPGMVHAFCGFYVAGVAWEWMLAGSVAPLVVIQIGQLVIGRLWPRRA